MEFGERERKVDEALSSSIARDDARSEREQEERENPPEDDVQETAPAEAGKRYRVIQVDDWVDGKRTKTTLGENLTAAEAAKLDVGANSNPDDSRLETTTELEEM
jgi:hypothetical protein